MGAVRYLVVLLLYIWGGFLNPTTTSAQQNPGEFIDTFIQGVNGMNDILFGPDGHLYICVGNGDHVLRYNGVTGAFMDIFGRRRRAGRSR